MRAPAFIEAAGGGGDARRGDLVVQPPADVVRPGLPAVARPGVLLGTRFNAAGQVQLELKTSWRDGTTHRVMSPLERMQRLAALVPPPPRIVDQPPGPSVMM